MQQQLHVDRTNVAVCQIHVVFHCIYSFQNIFSISHQLAADASRLNQANDEDDDMINALLLLLLLLLQLL